MEHEWAVKASCSARKRQNDNRKLQPLGHVNRHDPDGIGLALEFTCILLRILFAALFTGLVDAVREPPDQCLWRRTDLPDGVQRQIANLEDVRETSLAIPHGRKPRAKPTTVM